MLSYIFSGKKMIPHCFNNTEVWAHDMTFRFCSSAVNYLFLPLLLLQYPHTMVKYAKYFISVLSFIFFIDSTNDLEIIMYLCISKVLLCEHRLGVFLNA